MFRSSLLYVWVTRGPFGRRTKSLCDSGVIDSPSVSGGVPRGCLWRFTWLTTELSGGRAIDFRDLCDVEWAEIFFNVEISSIHSCFTVKHICE